MKVESNSPVTEPPDLGTRSQYWLRGQCYPHQASNTWESVSWDNHECETGIAEYVLHRYVDGWWVSAVQVHLLIPVKECYISTYSAHQQNKFHEHLIQCLFSINWRFKSSWMLHTQDWKMMKEQAVHSPKMSVFTSHHSISSHKTWIFIYTPVRTWQLILSLNCFNLHYETCTNYNLIAIEFHNLILWKIYHFPLHKTW